MNEGVGIKNFMIVISIDIQRLIFDYQMIVNVITRPVMKLEHFQDLSFFYKCRTFLYKKILSGYVRVLDLSSFLPPLLNNVGLKEHPVFLSRNMGRLAQFPFC